MSKYQALTNAIEAFQPGGADAPILYSTVEVNDRSFKALAGRKLKLWSIHTTILLVVCAIFLLAVSVVVAIWGAAPAPAAFAPLFIAFLFRTTFITVTDDGLDFYFIESRFGSKYVVSDKLSLPYDRISNVKVKVGRIFKQTNVTFEFLHNDKKRKIKVSMPNRMRKMEEQEGNLSYLLGVLKQKPFSSV